MAKNTAIDMARKNGRSTPTEDIYLDLEAAEEPAESPDRYERTAGD